MEFTPLPLPACWLAYESLLDCGGARSILFWSSRSFHLPQNAHALAVPFSTLEQTFPCFLFLASHPSSCRTSIRKRAKLSAKVVPPASPCGWPSSSLLRLPWVLPSKWCVVVAVVVVPSLDGFIRVTTFSLGLCATHQSQAKGQAKSLPATCWCLGLVRDAPPCVYAV